MKRDEFFEWIADGNVIKLSDGYATQCCQYHNRIKSISSLYRYFLKEF